MDAKLKAYIKQRALEVIRARSTVGLQADQLPQPEGAVGIGGSVKKMGKHKEGAKTKQANPHALLVGKLMKAHGLTMAQASKEAAKIRKNE